jgi:predicted permease
MALDVTVPTPVPFASWTFHMAVSDPRFEPVVEWIRGRRQANAERDEWARRTRGMLVLTGWAVAAAFVAAVALVPERDDVARIAGDTASSLVAMSTLAVGLGLALVHGIRALRDRDVRALAGALGYLVAAAAVFAIAWSLGLLDGWLAVLESIS